MSAVLRPKSTHFAGEKNAFEDPGYKKIHARLIGETIEPEKVPNKPIAKPSTAKTSRNYSCLNRKVSLIIAGGIIFSALSIIASLGISNHIPMHVGVYSTLYAFSGFTLIATTFFACRKDKPVKPIDEADFFDPTKAKLLKTKSFDLSCLKG